MRANLFGYDISVTKSSFRSEDEYASEEIKYELFSRIHSFFGQSGFKMIEKSFVIVVGLGGVGSHCAHMLARSGVGKLRIIDFDQVTLSSLNRHAVAAMADVGISKAETMKSKLKSIVPWCDIEAIPEMFVHDSADRLLGDSPTFVVDCIDDLNTKSELISYCIQHKIRFISALGAGAKADPTRLRIAPLSDCINDPLAQKLKWKLKKYSVVADDVICIFSIEKPICELLPLDDEQKNAPHEFGVVDYLRLRVIPVLGTSPSMFGQAMASYILCKIGGKMYEPESCERISKNLKNKLKQLLRNNELMRFKTAHDIDLADDDIEFIVQTVWKSRCPVTQKRFGGHYILTLVRWNELLPPSPYNLVLMMQPEAQKLIDKGRSVFPEETIMKIEQRLEWAKMISQDHTECGDVENQCRYKQNTINVNLVNVAKTVFVVLSFACLSIFSSKDPIDI